MSPLISIITPVYNTEKYLRQCVDSVLAQTYSNWELILVDDGSTDASSHICDLATRSTSKIKTIHQKNGGQSSARNRGLTRARGEYVTFLDSDDLLHPRFLELMSRQAFITKAPVVACKIKEFSYDLKPYSFFAIDMPSDKYTDNPKSILYHSEEATALALYQKKINLSACGKLYKSSLWKEEIFREGTGYEDLDILPLILLKSHITASYPLSLYFYRQHEESYVHRFSMKRTDVLKVTERLVNHMASHHPKLLPAALDRQLSANFNILGLIEANKRHLSNSNMEEARNICNDCWKKIKELRWRSLANAKVRFKNKTGILASYLGGRKLISFLSKIIYKN